MQHSSNPEDDRSKDSRTSTDQEEASRNAISRSIPTSSPQNISALTVQSSPETSETLQILQELDTIKSSCELPAYVSALINEAANLEAVCSDRVRFILREELVGISEYSLSALPPTIQANCLATIAELHIMEDDFDAALPYLKEASQRADIPLDEQIHHLRNYLVALGELHQDFGTTTQEMDNTIDSLTSLAQQVFREDLNEDELLAYLHAHDDISTALTGCGCSDRALSVLHEGITLFEQAVPDRPLAFLKIKSKLASFYAEYGLMTDQIETQGATANTIYKSTLADLDAHGDCPYAASLAIECLLSISRIFDEMEDQKRTYQYSKKAYQKARSLLQQVTREKRLDEDYDFIVYDAILNSFYAHALNTSLEKDSLEKAMKIATAGLDIAERHTRDQFMPGFFHQLAGRLLHTHAQDLGADQYFNQAREHFEESVVLLEQYHEEPFTTGISYFHLAETVIRLTEKEDDATAAKMWRTATVHLESALECFNKENPEHFAILHNTYCLLFDLSLKLEDYENSQEYLRQRDRYQEAMQG